MPEISLVRIALSRPEQRREIVRLVRLKIGLDQVRRNPDVRHHHLSRPVVQQQLGLERRKCDRDVGPNLHLAHDSHPGDGQLDVVLVTDEHRDRLLYYLEHWQENRERLAMLPTLRGKRLQVEWTGFALHIDDKLQPGAKAKPKSCLLKLAKTAAEIMLPPRTDGRTRRSLSIPMAHAAT